MKALHIGCETELIDGWINTDFSRACWLDIEDKARITLLDAERKFPFNDNELDYIYSEHVIEHLTYNGFINYIKESYRCLKPGGVVRTACPYLDFLFNLLKNPKKYKKYIYHHCELFNNELLEDWDNDVPAMFVINDNFKMWEHKVLYDKDTLIKMFKKYGFDNIKVCDYGKSDHEALQNLEHDNKRGHRDNVLETIIIECIK